MYKFSDEILSFYRQTQESERLTADAVLLLGPIYHLIDKSERLLALKEARRVLQKGGVIVAAGISRFASMLDIFFKDRLGNLISREIVQNDLETGYHRNPTENLEFFTDAYLHRPEELRSEVIEAGFQHQAHLQCKDRHGFLDRLKAIGPILTNVPRLWI